MFTEMFLHPDEFDYFHLRMDSDITFCLKELRVRTRKSFWQSIKRINSRAILWKWLMCVFWCYKHVDGVNSSSNTDFFRTHSEYILQLAHGCTQHTVQAKQKFAVSLAYKWTQHNTNKLTSKNRALMNVKFHIWDALLPVSFSSSNQMAACGVLELMLAFGHNVHVL